MGPYTPFTYAIFSLTQCNNLNTVGTKKYFEELLGWFAFLLPRAQSFTRLMADLHQDISRGSSFTKALMEHFLEGIAPLRYLYINLNEKSNKYKSSLLS